MKIAIATVQVPFIRGGAEVLAESLRRELRARGYETELVTIPFKWYPAETLVECMMAGRMIDLTEVNGQKIDLVVAMKFPAYYLCHPQKVLWLMHQHRQAYDLWDTPLSDIQGWPGGEDLRRMIVDHDNRYLAEAVRRYTISGNVSRRLERFNGLASAPLYPPPDHAERFGCEAYEPYIFYASRIDPMKRQRLLIEAAALMRNPARVVIAGTGFDQEIAALRHLIEQRALSQRVELSGFISDDAKLQHYARCGAVFFGGLDEDYGYVPLEAGLASKPVVTLTDCGGALEFVNDGVNGSLCAPEPAAIAAAFDRLFDDSAQAERMGREGRRMIEAKRIGWDHVIAELLGRSA